MRCQASSFPRIGGSLERDGILPWRVPRVFVGRRVPWIYEPPISPVEEDLFVGRRVPWIYEPPMELVGHERSLAARPPSLHRRSARRHAAAWAVRAQGQRKGLRVAWAVVAREGGGGRAGSSQRRGNLTPVVESRVWLSSRRQRKSRCDGGGVSSRPVELATAERISRRWWRACNEDEGRRGLDRPVRGGDEGEGGARVTVETRGAIPSNMMSISNETILHRHNTCSVSTISDGTSGTYANWLVIWA